MSPTFVTPSAFFPKKRTWPIPVIRELKRDDAYDVIFVVMRYTQLDSVIPVLQANATKNIVFVGNNVRCEEYRNRLPEKNVLFAFASMVPPTIMTLNFIWLIFGFGIAIEKFDCLEREKKYNSKLINIRG